MKSNRKVFVAIDFSPAADEALRQAHERAVSPDDQLAVCHIIPNELRSNLLFPQFTKRAALEVPVEVETISEAVARRVSEITGRTDRDVEIIADHGTPYAEILTRAEAWGADLIVVGSHGMTSDASVLLGGVTDKVIRYAHSPVLVARPAKVRGRIVAGTDFSDPALPAVEAAVEEVNRTKGQLSIVHSLELFWTLTSAGAMGGGYPVISEEVYTEMQKAAHERMEGILHKFGTHGDILVKRGPAGPVLVSVATEINAELLVVGTVGRTGLRRLLLGSVAETVASHAPCSVLIVRLHPATD
jgi:nucleotide-binding universal stress UspA family protein